MCAAKITFLGYSGKTLKCQNNQDIENITTLINYSYSSHIILHLRNQNQVPISQ